MPNDAMVTKMLLIGDSGSGKTGATYSLLRAGYNLRFLDFDKSIGDRLSAIISRLDALSARINEVPTATK